MEASSKPVKALILGYGIRGRAYASYASTHPRDFEIAGLADPVAEFPADATYPTWKSWEEALNAGVAAAIALYEILRQHAEPGSVNHPAENEE